MTTITTPSPTVDLRSTKPADSQPVYGVDSCCGSCGG